MAPRLVRAVLSGDAERPAMATTRSGSATGPNTDALVSYLRERFGESFRSCVVYDGDECGVRFVREDISRAAARSRIDRVRHLYEGERAARDPEPADPDFGPLYASTHVFSGAIVVHLLTRDGTAVGFSLDHPIGGNLTAFVTDCIDVLCERESTRRR